MFRNLRFTLVLALTATLAAGAAFAQGRDLSGRIYFGHHTQLHLQEDESVITNLLRAVKLVTRDVPVLNLNSIAIKNDYLFIGEDHELYYMDKTKRDVVYHVGTAYDLSNIKLNDGVSLKAVENINAAFESGQRELALKVVMTKEQELAPEGTKRARFSHWLNELVTLYDETTMTEGDKRNYTILINALSSALPDGDNEDPRAFEHLKILKKYIEANNFASATPLEQLVESTVKRVRENVQDEELAQAAKDVLPAYEKLVELLAKSAQ